MRGALFVSLFLTFVSAILLLLILVAGTNKNILVDWFFLKTDTKELQIPSRLSESTFLKDLSQITGVDLVGKDADASSLGLADSYTISLWSSCAEDDKSTKCSSTKFGYVFDPLADLKLDDTAMEGSFTPDWLGAVSYKHASRFIGLAYIAALILSVGTFAANILSCCAGRAIVISAILSIIATITTAAASITSIAVFSQVRGRYNDQLKDAGIKTSLGNRLFVVSWVAFGLLFINSILLCVHHRKNSQSRSSKRRAGKGSIISASAVSRSVGAEGGEFGPPKRTKTLQLLKQIPTPWNKHKYAQIDRQAGAKSASDYQDDRENLVKRGFGGGEDEEMEGEMDLGRGPKGANKFNIPLVEVTGANRDMDRDTAYEPFRHTADVSSGNRGK